MIGVNRNPHRLVKAVIDQDIGENGPRQDYMRAICSQTPDGFNVSPLNRQDSSMLSALSQSNCYIVRKPNAPALRSGDRTDIMLIDYV